MNRSCAAKRIEDACGLKIQAGGVHTAFLSVGSNMGCRAENCRRAIVALDSADGISVEAVSRFFLTEPVDYKDQRWFVNAVVKIVTTLSPQKLLDLLKKIERDAGRRRGPVRFGPRPLDLDILFFDDIVMEIDSLAIPHPRMHERRFVLGPLCDIDPDVVHPVLKKTARQLYESLGEDGQKVVARSL